MAHSIIPGTDSSRRVDAAAGRKPDTVRYLGPVDVETLRVEVERLSEKVWQQEDAVKENAFFCFAHVRHVIFRFILDNRRHLRCYSNPAWLGEAGHA